MTRGERALFFIGAGSAAAMILTLIDQEFPDIHTATRNFVAPFLALGLHVGIEYTATWVPRIAKERRIRKHVRELEQKLESLAGVDGSEQARRQIREECEAVRVLQAKYHARQARMLLEEP